MTRHPLRLGIVHAWLGFAASTLLVTGPAGAEERVTFLGVALDQETRQADERLRDHLYRTAGVSFSPEDLDYERAVERLAGWDPADGWFVARTTPYVYVVAEMLGARFEALATYVGATTDATTYHAYFVVRRSDFESLPTVGEVVEWLAERPQRARFVYHSPFSTSSFFLPSLLFRENRIFAMEEATASLTAIESHRIDESSSSRLVELVADGEADLAAVWDGTKARFETGERWDRHGQNVWFVRLPTALPNDLLVCSEGLPDRVKDALRSSIEAMGAEEIGIGDFRTWRGMRHATEARLALANLRWLARERGRVATVEVRVDPEHAGRPGAAPALEAARQAVRLSSTELTLFDQDFHAHIDFRWTVEPIHDGALELVSALPGSDVPNQVFRLSFRNTDDLAKRIVTLVQTRLHRIRSLWAYRARTPLVIRDTALALPIGSPVVVQEVTWIDPERNEFRGGRLFRARVAAADFFTYRLDPAAFPPDLELDPLSNQSYRVVLVRPERRSLLLERLGLGFVFLFVAAGLGAVVDLVRRSPGVARGDAASRASGGRPSR